MDLGDPMTHIPTETSLQFPASPIIISVTGGQDTNPYLNVTYQPPALFPDLYQV